MGNFEDLLRERSDRLLACGARPSRSPKNKSPPTQLQQTSLFLLPVTFDDFPINSDHPMDILQWWLRRSGDRSGSATRHAIFGS